MKEGTPTVTKMATIATVTINSIRVKPGILGEPVAIPAKAQPERTFPHCAGEAPVGVSGETSRARNPRVDRVSAFNDISSFDNVGKTAEGINKTVFIKQLMLKTALVEPQCDKCSSKILLQCYEHI
jgi:hypothetical protein